MYQGRNCSNFLNHDVAQGPLVYFVSTKVYIYINYKLNNVFINMLFKNPNILFFAADTLLENKVGIVGVYSSPALRCLQTATEIYQGQNNFCFDLVEMHRILQ